MCGWGRGGAEVGAWGWGRVLGLCGSGAEGRSRPPRARGSEGAEGLPVGGMRCGLRVWGRAGCARAVWRSTERVWPG